MAGHINKIISYSITLFSGCCLQEAVIEAVEGRKKRLKKRKEDDLHIRDKRKWRNLDNGSPQSPQRHRTPFTQLEIPAHRTDFETDIYPITKGFVNISLEKVNPQTCNVIGGNKENYSKQPNFKN